jgi:hypothetical protein
LVPSLSVTLSTVTKLAVTTFLELKLAVPVAVMLSVPTNPAAMAKVGRAVVVPSYALLGAVTVAVKGAGVTEATPICPVASW